VTPRLRILVVGGGIGGVAAAHFLTPDCDVTVVEKERSLAHHTTGRSAALFFENYGAGPIRPLSKGSRPFLESPPADLTEHPLLSPRGALTIAAEPDLDDLERILEEGLATGTVVERIDTRRVRELCDVVRPEAAAGGLWEPHAADIDVAGLHQIFVRGTRSRGGELRTNTEVHSAVHHDGGWRVDLGETSWEGDLIVDAAGAWGDVLAERCGVEPIGLRPLRRTAFMVGGTAQSSAWPLVVEVHHSFYFKPDGEQLLCSLSDETLSPPCDARPEEIDVALAIDRITTATTLDIRHVRSQWAGLRTFAPDRSMVIGRDPSQPAFVWLVGQGGTGIQTAPAAGRLAAALALDRTVPDDLDALGLDPSMLSAARFRPTVTG
jgi:D-arginine dehydrogenase